MTALGLIAAVWRTLQSLRWQAAAYDDEWRTELMAIAVAEKLDGGRAPTAAAVRRELDRAGRNARIRAQHERGVSIPALAIRHGLSGRQVRRIVETPAGRTASAPASEDGP